MEIWEATTWVRIASLKIWNDATLWIASRVVQLVRTQGTTSAIA